MDCVKLKEIIDVSMGRMPADLCISDCKIVDVFNKKVFEGSVYVKHGIIAGFGETGFPVAKETFDAKGKYLAPGFIDSHIHIESSHLTPSQYAKLSIPCGTTTVIADPHEICNVCGLAGFDYMRKESEGLPLSILFQVPSCVPCTSFENSGAVLSSEDIASKINEPGVLGLGELMDFVNLQNGDSSVLEKVIVANNASKVIDGHCPGLQGVGLDAYSSCGVRNDHECSDETEMLEKIRRGMYVMLRQGSASHDLEHLAKYVNDDNSRFCTLCTDDCQAATLLTDGHIDNSIRLLIHYGVNPLTAIQMATLNASQCYHLNDRGAITPGRRADFVIISSLDENMSVEEVFASGRHVASNHSVIVDIPMGNAPSYVTGKMNIKDTSIDSFKLRLTSNEVVTIDVIPQSIVTSKGSAVVKTDEDSCWVRDEQDIVKVAVFERHKSTGNVGLALIRGLGLENGAIGTTVAHDSHNAIVTGDNDRDMKLVLDKLVEMGGGMAVAHNGKIISYLQHEIAGLMTNSDGNLVAQSIDRMHKDIHEILHVKELIDPFMALSFMSLVLIPSVKVSDRGLFDFNQFKFIPVEK